MIWKPILDDCCCHDNSIVDSKPTQIKQEGSDSNDGENYLRRNADLDFCHSLLKLEMSVREKVWNIWKAVAKIRTIMSGHSKLIIISFDSRVFSQNIFCINFIPWQTRKEIELSTSAKPMDLHFVHRVPSSWYNGLVLVECILDLVLLEGDVGVVMACFALYCLIYWWGGGRTGGLIFPIRTAGHSLRTSRRYWCSSLHYTTLQGTLL